MTHELGHNFGLGHANARNCIVGRHAGHDRRRRRAARPRATRTRSRTMGNNALRHNHGSQLGELGWLDASEKVVGAPGNTYTIAPYLGTGPVKLVRIPRGDGTSSTSTSGRPTASSTTSRRARRPSSGVDDPARLGHGQPDRFAPGHRAPRHHAGDERPQGRPAPRRQDAHRPGLHDLVHDALVDAAAASRPGQGGHRARARRARCPRPPRDTPSRRPRRGTPRPTTWRVAALPGDPRRLAVATRERPGPSWTDTTAKRGADLHLRRRRRRHVRQRGGRRHEGRDHAGRPDPSPPRRRPPTPDPTPARHRRRPRRRRPRRPRRRRRRRRRPTTRPRRPRPSRSTGTAATTTVSLSWGAATDDTGVIRLPGHAATGRSSRRSPATRSRGRTGSRKPPTTYTYTVAALDTRVQPQRRHGAVRSRPRPTRSGPSTPRHFRVAQALGQVRDVRLGAVDRQREGAQVPDLPRGPRQAAIAATTRSWIRFPTVRGAQVLRPGDRRRRTTGASRVRGTLRGR